MEDISVKDFERLLEEWDEEEYIDALDCETEPYDDEKLYGRIAVLS